MSSGKSIKLHRTLCTPVFYTEAKYCAGYANYLSFIFTILKNGSAKPTEKKQAPNPYGPDFPKGKNSLK